MVKSNSLEDHFEDDFELELTFLRGKTLLGRLEGYHQGNREGTALTGNMASPTAMGTQGIPTGAQDQILATDTIATGFT
jgi:hypothetical protein